MKRGLGIKTVLSAVLVIALLMAIGTEASAAYSVKQKLFGFGGTAGEALVTGDVVCIKGADGLVYKADADAAALRPAVGIVGLGAASGSPVEIITHGIFRGWTSLSEGQNAYLSTTAGAVTQSAPAYAQKIGFAISTTEYLFSVQEYLDTSALTALGVLTGATPLIFEGATADDYETTIAVTDPTADRTITIPNKTGQVQLASAAVALTPGAAVTLTVGLSNVYSLTTTDNEDTTITFSGAGTAGDEITIICATSGTADEVVTFHATLVSSVGTLTLGTAAGKFYVVRFISDGSHWYEVSRTAVQT